MCAPWPANMVVATSCVALGLPTRTRTALIAVSTSVGRRSYPGRRFTAALSNVRRFRISVLRRAVWVVCAATTWAAALQEVLAASNLGGA